MAWRPSFILTTQVLYSSRTMFTKNNTKIHLIFTLWSSLFPFVSNNYANLYYSKCFLGEKEKWAYVVCKRPSIYCTKGYIYIYNVWITRLVQSATQWITSMKIIYLL
jgi:hypothetical protein